MSTFTISTPEILRRIHRLQEFLRETNQSGACIFAAMRTFYLSGFHHLPTERPVVLVVPADDDVAIMVPFLEEENIPVRTPHITNVAVYREYPGKKHPMLHLRDLLVSLHLDDKPLAVDSLNWGGGWGYRGPSLPDVVPRASFTNIADVIDDWRMVKSPEELRLLAMSSRLADLAHGCLHEAMQPGLTEIEISMRATTAATVSMANLLGPSWEGSGAKISFTSGPKTAHNHRSAGGRRVQRGDVILTGSGPVVGGYLVELERMMIVGEPSQQQRKYFELEVQAQDVALAAIKPGARCGDVERAVNAFLEREGLMELARTHIGHGIGIEGHEGPFLDEGDDTLLQTGMVLCVEPCLFLPGMAGFRHSDTVLVTEQGFEFITTYPRDIESLTVHV